MKNRISALYSRPNLSMLERPARKCFASANRLVHESMSRRPLVALGVMVAVGMALGWLVKRR